MKGTAYGDNVRTLLMCPPCIPHNACTGGLAKKSIATDDLSLLPGSNR